MKSRTLISTLTFIQILSFNLSAAKAQSQSPKYSPFAMSLYSEFRAEYEPPPVQIMSLRGGKPGTNEKLQIEVTLLKNKTVQHVRAIKFKAFIFDRRDLNQSLETVETPLVKLEIPPFEQLHRKILILNADDIPLLGYRPGAQFRLEVAVAEVHYDDGSIWQAKGLPGKLDPSKMP